MSKRLLLGLACAPSTQLHPRKHVSWGTEEGKRLRLRGNPSLMAILYPSLAHGMALQIWEDTGRSSARLWCM